MQHLGASPFSNGVRRSAPTRAAAWVAALELGSSGLLFFLCCGLVLMLTGCASGGYPGAGISSLSAAAITLDAGQSTTISATLSQTIPLTWSLSGGSCSGVSCGTLSSTTGTSVIYTAPSGITGPLTAILQANVSGTGNAKRVTITVNPDPAISGNPPAGVVGTPYTTTIGTSGGTAPLKLTLLSGSLPAGLSFNATTGVISGTPTAPGTSSFVLQLTDSSDVPYTVTAAKQIVVTAPGTALLVVGGNPPSGTVGTPYMTSLTAAGGTGPYTWTVAAGSLPAGLTLSPAGTITGTPTTQGTSSFTAQATDATGATAAGSFDITVGTAAPGAVMLTVTSLPNGTVMVPYNATLGVSGGSAPYTCTIVAGTLPAGLTLGNACVVSGTPTTAGTANLTVTATDSSNPGQTTSGTVSLTIAPAPVSLTTGTLPNGTVATPYSSTVGVSGGTGPYTCALAAGTLPAGLTLGADCVVSGTPSVAGTATVTVKAADSGNPAATTTGPVSLTIVPSGLALATGTLPNGTVGTPYSATVGVNGGTAPYHCALVAGTLPAGLTLGAGCLVSGTPTVAGTATVTVKATDASNPTESTTGPESITINAAPMLAISSPPAASVGTPYSTLR